MAAFDGLKEAMALERKLKFVERQEFPSDVKAKMIADLKAQIAAVLSQKDMFKK